MTDDITKARYAEREACATIADELGGVRVAEEIRARAIFTEAELEAEFAALFRGSASYPNASRSIAEKRQVLNRLFALWLLAPEQRLGQLLVNASGSVSPVELFSFEDAALLEALARFIKEPL